MAKSQTIPVVTSRHIQLSAMNPLKLLTLFLLISFLGMAQEFEWAIEPKFQATNSFGEGLAPAKFNNKWGFIDKTGTWVIQPKFRNASYFSEGLAWAQSGNTENGCEDGGYVDKTGNWIVKPIYDIMTQFKNGYARVSWDQCTSDEGNWAKIDKKGNIVNISYYEYTVMEGLKLFELDEKWGYKDTLGNIVIPARFDEADYFSDGLAEVTVDDKRFFIDKKGNVIFEVQPIFGEISRFNNGQAKTQQNKKFGYIGKTGAWVIQPQFESAGDFKAGVAVVKQNDLYGFIGKRGEWIIKPQFLWATDFSEDVAAVKVKDGQAGFIKLPPPTAIIKNYVENKIAEWQQKGEFEKTVDYQTRVTDAGRNAKIQEYTGECVELLKKDFSENINWSGLRLNQYDADHETYLITSPQIAGFALPVPLADAKNFKNQWPSMKFSNADFYLDNETFRLARLTITNPISGKTYFYNSKQTTTYASSNITYNFEPIKVDVSQNTLVQNNTKVEQNKIVVGTSDVDINIPISNQTADKTFAVILANEYYQKEVNVRFAANDGKVFKEYCEKTLGIPSKNIHFVQDATFGNMKSEIRWICDVISAYSGQARIIFYYAGHGMPDEASKSSYLLPVDGFSSDFESAIKLDDLYTRLVTHPSQSVTIFLDACFSGSTRDDDMLANARSVRVKPKPGTISGNTVIFSATTGDETAYPYKEKQHGLFTYFLLKKLQETKGDVDYQSLSDYIIENVKQQSIVVNQKSQTPQVNTSYEIHDTWHSIKMR